MRFSTLRLAYRATLESFGGVFNARRIALSRRLVISSWRGCSATFSFIWRLTSVSRMQTHYHFFRKLSQVQRKEDDLYKHKDFKQMARKQSVRFVVRKAGRQRCILSVAEMREGDLIIDIRGRQFDADRGFHPFPSDGQDLGTPIVENRYTVHPTPKSAEINKINYHYTTADGNTFVNSLFTKAIKQDNLFHIMFSRYCSTLSGDYYDVGIKKRDIIDLGVFDQTFTLFYTLVIGPPNKKFPDHGVDFSVRQVQFELFSRRYYMVVFNIPQQREFALFEGCLGEPIVSFSWNGYQHLYRLSQERIN